MPKLNQLPLAEGLLIGEKVVDALRVACERIEIVGSIRRKRPLVHDVDLVIVPLGRWIKGKTDMEPMPNENRWFDIPRLIRDMNGRIINSGIKIITAVVDDFQIDINCARDDNWGILHLLKTGPEDFNKELCNRAKRLEKELHIYSGIWRKYLNEKKELVEERYSARTEEDIFKALQFDDPIPPTERDAAVARLRSGMML